MLEGSFFCCCCSLPAAAVGIGWSPVWDLPCRLGGIGSECTSTLCTASSRPSWGPMVGRLGPGYIIDSDDGLILDGEAANTLGNLWLLLVRGATLFCGMCLRAGGVEHQLPVSPAKSSSRLCKEFWSWLNAGSMYRCGIGRPFGVVGQDE